MPTKKDVVAAEYFYRYINAVKGNDVVKELKKNTKDFKKFLAKIPKKKIDFAYAEGKWTIRQMLQHIIDAERVFAYRSLSFSRKDPAPLPGFEENDWANVANLNKRKWSDLVKEFNAVRKSTEYLFSSFTPEQFLTTGVASNNNINPVGLGFICSGHVIHHMKIIKERYL
ncbi:MAG: DinB family protein [Bacteroidetes bacterium]|nr:DinB family protein [Bacteroidota bacterium]